MKTSDFILLPGKKENSGKIWEFFPSKWEILWYNMSMRFKAVLKKFFSIEAILIYFGIVTLSISIYYKNQAAKLFAEYEHEAVRLILLNNSIAGGEAVITQAECDALKDKYYPFTYFDYSLEEKLDQIILRLREPSLDTNSQKELSSLILDFQDALSQKEISLVFGYDSLMYCSSLLLLISILCIIFKTIKQKNQIKNLKLRNDEQQKMSRNLHDGVAQDLAALKFYLQQEDKEKSDFYADQALKEVRYLIGALHLDLSEDFEAVLRQILSAFESNYKIRTNVFVSASHISALPQNGQIEIIRIFQEALSNIARHANSTEVTVKITEVAGDLKLIISDNGVGFNMEKFDELNKADSRKHYGVQNIQERVNSLGGTVEFVNNGGTTIAITIKNIIY